MTGFDRVARLYRWVEYLALGPLLNLTRNHYLPQLRHINRATLFGDGDGRFLARLLQQNPSMRALAIDASPRMLKLLATRCSFAGARLELQLNRLSDAVPESDTDLLVTHFVLDCLPQHEVEAFAQRCFLHTRPGTLWLLSEFAPMRSAWLRPFSRLYIRSLYLAFRILAEVPVSRLPDSRQALSSAGFQLLDRHERVNGLLYTELWRRP